MNAIIREIEQSQVIRKNVPFQVGNTVKVSLRIKEGEKERIQVYEGVVTSIERSGAKMRFTVRKISYGVGVEKTFLYQSPMIKEVKTTRVGKVRRAKLFYLRNKLNKKDARIQESRKGIRVPGAEEKAETVTVETVAPAEVSAAPAPVEAAPPAAEAKAPATEAPKKD